MTCPETGPFGVVHDVSVFLGDRDDEVVLYVHGAQVVSAQIQGGGGSDHLVSYASSSTILGEQQSGSYVDGDDVIEDHGTPVATSWLDGGGGDDSLIEHGTGTNTLNGGRGSDVLRGGTGGDILNGDQGDDLLDGGTAADVINGGDGTDTVDYSSRVDPVSVTIGNGLADDGGDADGATHDKVGADVENVIGGSGADVLTGSSGPNVLTGGPGADTLDGGEGEDTADYSDHAAAVSVTVGTPGNGNAEDGAGDTLSAIEDLRGGAGSDALTGDGAANQLDGGPGADTLDGADGADGLRSLADGRTADQDICGPGIDTVNADDVDTIAPDCEGSTRLAVLMAPAITGLARESETLTGTPGTWMSSPPGVNYVYEWVRCDTAGAQCQRIPQATEATRTLTADDVGATLRLRVVGESQAGGPAAFDSAVSAPTAVVAARPQDPPPPAPPLPAAPGTPPGHAQLPPITAPPVVRPPTVTPPNALALSSLRQSRERLALRVVLPRAGRIDVTVTARLRAGSRRVTTIARLQTSSSRPGARTLTLRLSRSARTALAKSRHLKAKVTVKLTPAGGKAQTVTRSTVLTRW